MLKVDLGDTIRNDPDVKTVFDETVLLIAVSQSFLVGEH